MFFRHNHSTVRVQVGGGDLSDNSIKHFEVDEIFKRNVNIYTYYNDIALLKLKTSADDDILQQQVILRAMETVESAECFIYGYGSLQLNGISSEKLYYGRVDLISLQECERIMGRVWAPSDNTGQFCALGRNGIDACNGNENIKRFIHNTNVSLHCTIPKFRTIFSNINCFFLFSF